MCGGSVKAGAPSCTGAPIPRRDQSYFLYATTREQLDYLRFPLGGLPKDEVRRIAAEVGLERGGQARQPGHLLRARWRLCRGGEGMRPEAEAPGEIVDLDGRVLGAHRGVIHFTVGQRRGLEIGGQAEPLYVVRIEPEHAALVVGPRRALAVEARRVAENWIGAAQRRSSAKVRSLAKPVPARSTATGSASTEPEYGVAPAGGGALCGRARARRRMDRGDLFSRSKRDECRGRIALASFFSGSGMVRFRCCHQPGDLWPKEDVGAWIIPEGMVEQGETALEAAVREFEEEVGVELNETPVAAV